MLKTLLTAEECTVYCNIILRKRSENKGGAGQSPAVGWKNRVENCPLSPAARGKERYMTRTNRPFSRDGIKLAAMLTMACNHFAIALLPAGTLAYEVLTDIGYFTAVTMCFFLVEGFRYTRSRRDYALRLLLFGVVTQPVYGLALGIGQLNMMFTLALCFLMLWARERIRNPALRGAAVFVLAVATVFCDWPLLAACYTLLFAWAGTSPRRQAVAFGSAAALFFWFEWTNYTYLGMDGGPAALHGGAACLGILVSGAVILLGYSGRRSPFALAHPRISKYFFYLFYPAHLGVLALCRAML